MIVGVGIDLVAIEHISFPHKNEWLQEILHPAEIEYAQLKKHAKNVDASLAGHIAAKEAIYKAVVSICPSLKWKDILIKHHDSGAPFCLIRTISQRYQIIISISHHEKYAVAVAILEQQSIKD